MKLRLKAYLFQIFIAFVLIFTTTQCVEQDNTEFSLDILQNTISASDKSKNIVISPISIQTCLALTFIGADGKTAEELSTGLRLGTMDKNKAASNFNQILSRPDINSLVKIANKIYSQNDVVLKSQFNEIATKQFQSKAENIDFTTKDVSAKKINNWVEEQTNNKIKNLIDPLSLEGATMILVNAIYFRGQWKNPFYERATYKGTFWNDENDSSQVDLMSVEDDFDYAELEDLDATAIALPYNNSEIYMLVIVPNKKTGLKNLEKKLEQIDLSKIKEEMETLEVSLRLPKFKTEFSIKLNEILIKMGMSTMFTNDADFHHLTDEKIKVDEVFHKAVIEVDEAGTEAAAATYLKGVLLSSPINSIKYLTVDRPFMYFIKDDKTTYFSGRISKL